VALFEGHDSEQMDELIRWLDAYEIGVVDRAEGIAAD
jgi:hypothetical protein